MLPNFT